MRAGPEAPPVAVEPVAEVVPALARPGRAQFDTSYQARPGRGAAGRRSARSGRRRRRRPGAGSSPRRTRRASAVPSSTISAYAETWSTPASSTASSGAAQVVVGLAGGGVDQVEVDVREPGRARLPRGRDGASRRVPAVQHREHVRRGGLHAQRHPGEPGVDAAPAKNSGEVDSGLDSVVTSAPGASPNVERIVVQHRAEPLRPEQRRRAAADEHGVDRPRSRRPRGQRELPAHRLQPAVRATRRIRPARTRCRC